MTAIADLKEGDAAATAWGCDLTHEYISINADYRSENMSVKKELFAGSKIRDKKIGERT